MSRRAPTILEDKAVVLIWGEKHRFNYRPDLYLDYPAKDIGEVCKHCSLNKSADLCGHPNAKCAGGVFTKV